VYNHGVAGKAKRQTTHFASPERLSLPEARRQAAAVGEDPGLRGLAAVSPDMLAVLNRHRQVVYANAPMRELLEDRALESICGFRPGELLGCVHASETEAGCGTAPGCRHCGAAQAILKTQRTGQSAREECTISAGGNGALKAYNFQVTTSPLEIDGDEFLLLSLRDLSAEKHRQALQRIFFHDLLNTVSGFKMQLELLKRRAENEGCRETIARLERIGDQLLEEIGSQKLMVSAEARTLEVQRNLVVSGSLAEELLESFGAAAAPDKAPTLELAPFFESVSFICDEAILRRVLTNMIKNALEASAPGQTVRLGCRKDEAGLSFSVHNPGHMPPEVQEQVFQRFFTTKGAGRGLGTYGMKLLAEQYLGGRVRFESSPEQGTTFTVWLPARLM